MENGSTDGNGMGRSIHEAARKGIQKPPAKTFERRREDENKVVIRLGNRGHYDIAFVR